MSTALGIKGILGVGQQTNYETAVNATDMVPFMSESLNIEGVYGDHDYLFGSAAVPGTEKLFEPVPGSIEARIPYTQKDTGGDFVSTDTLIALAMGVSTWHAGTTANQLTFVNDLEVNATIAVDKGYSTSTWETVGAMVNSMTISGNSAEFLSASFDIIGKNQTITASQNTAAEMQALVYNLPSLLHFSDLTFRLADQANALGAADEVAISSFTLSVNNNLTEPTQATPDPAMIDKAADTYDHTTMMQTIKPRRNGFRECTLEITLPRYTNDTWLNARNSETLLMADFTFTDGVSTYYIYLPNIRIQSATAPIAGQEAVPQTISFKCLMYNSHGFMTFSDAATTSLGEVWIELISERTAAILA